MQKAVALFPLARLSLYFFPSLFGEAAIDFVTGNGLPPPLFPPPPSTARQPAHKEAVQRPVSPGLAGRRYSADMHSQYFPCRGSRWARQDDLQQQLSHMHGVIVRIGQMKQRADSTTFLRRDLDCGRRQRRSLPAGARNAKLRERETIREQPPGQIIPPWLRRHR
ncbi:uncharacterized protein K452DRAFT_39527 [Aplosporella prunicola CBS 121167]|uniref:Secreted protein n=1 Tax=Aplosporella prunicola CBS 121167 TaxID=1176127 RepID=A0A6A6BBE8_9PEZI|nr:uncharacterized protein K452DRAFT_39527 [Aplosporella prunicola CBS 121167]KAF2141440.1 hypothetical protein K452DRAFT_39527 [Aplosporella prunicola CBS 121167]